MKGRLRRQECDDWLDAAYGAGRTEAVRLASAVSGSTFQAEDIADEAFFRCSAKAHPDRGSFQAYWNKAVVRGCLDARRKGVRRKRREERYAEDRSRTAEPAESAALRKVEMAGEVVELLDLLNPDQRAAVVLRYWLGYTDSDLADALDCPIGTVKSRLSRALETMRSELCLK